jgi:hypothetical protein
MHRWIALLTGLLVSCPAWAYNWGGGGVALHHAPITFSIPGHGDVQNLGCFGGVGFGVRNGRRRGGEGHLCGSELGGMAFAGVQLGRASKGGGLYWTAHNSLGAGFLALHAGGPFWDSLFVYARPSFGLGLPVGRIGAVEGTLYANLPLNIVSVYSGVQPRLSHAHAGIQVSLLMGRFRRGPRAPQAHGVSELKPI